MRRDSTADLYAELTDECAAPQFVEHERTQMFARRYEDLAVTIDREVDRWFDEQPTATVSRSAHARLVPRARLAAGTQRQVPVAQRRPSAPTPADLDASYDAAMRALR